MIERINRNRSILVQSIGKTWGNLKCCFVDGAREHEEVVAYHRNQDQF